MLVDLLSLQKHDGLDHLFVLLVSESMERGCVGRLDWRESLVLLFLDPIGNTSGSLHILSGEVFIVHGPVAARLSVIDISRNFGLTHEFFF